MSLISTGSISLDSIFNFYVDKRWGLHSTYSVYPFLMGVVISRSSLMKPSLYSSSFLTGATAFSGRFIAAIVVFSSVLSSMGSPRLSSVLAYKW
jgi:hypothetical protein